MIAREEKPGIPGFALKRGVSIDLLKSCSGLMLLAFAPPGTADRMIVDAESRI